MEYYEPRIIHGGKGRYGQYHKSIGNSNVSIDGQYTILMQEIPSLKPPDIYLNGIKMVTKWSLLPPLAMVDHFLTIWGTIF